MIEQIIPRESPRNNRAKLLIDPIYHRSNGRPASSYRDADLMIDRTHYYVQKSGGRQAIFCILSCGLC